MFWFSIYACFKLHVSYIYFNSRPNPAQHAFISQQKDSNSNTPENIRKYSNTFWNTLPNWKSEKSEKFKSTARFGVRRSSVESGIRSQWGHKFSGMCARSSIMKICKVYWVRNTLVTIYNHKVTWDYKLYKTGLHPDSEPVEQLFNFSKTVRKVCKNVWSKMSILKRAKKFSK